MSTINHKDPDVTQVAAALADACHSGGLSDGYYREADDALQRLADKQANAVQFAEGLAELIDIDAGKGLELTQALRELVDAVHAEFPVFETARTVEAYAAALDALGIEHSLLGAVANSD